MQKGIFPIGVRIRTSRLSRYSGQSFCGTESATETAKPRYTPRSTVETASVTVTEIATAAATKPDADTRKKGVRQFNGTMMTSCVSKTGRL